MVRIGYLLGIVAPLVLLALNLGLGFGGILGTIALFVWLGTGIVLVPAAEDA